VAAVTIGRAPRWPARARRSNLTTLDTAPPRAPGAPARAASASLAARPAPLDAWIGPGGAEAFGKTFRIPPTEVPLNAAYAAAVRPARRALWGVLALSPSFLCFRGERFGCETRLAVHFSRLLSLTQARARTRARALPGGAGADRACV